jgi:hypothetical protein
LKCCSGVKVRFDFQHVHFLIFDLISVLLPVMLIYIVVGSNVSLLDFFGIGKDANV